MKKALILHGTKNNSLDNWFPWLSSQLSDLGYAVWSPDLPKAEKPNLKTYNEFLLNNPDFALNSESILIGHSSGAVAVLGLLQNLPAGTTVDTCYLVGIFKDDLGWEALNELFLAPLDYALIKTKAKKFIFIHSDNDPYCSLDGANFIRNKLEGDLVLLPGQFHFSISTAGEKYKEFPELFKLIAKHSDVVL